MIAGMSTVADRIRRVREDRLGISQEAFADRLGVKRGAVGNWELGKGIKRENLLKIAQEAGVSFDWLATGRGSEDASGLPQTTVPIVGRVGANPDGTILYSDGDDPGDRVRLAPGTDANSVAVLVVGDSMGPGYRSGSLLFYEARHEPPTKDMLGEVVIVALDTGEVLLKRLLRGSAPGLYDLESVNGGMRSDCRVAWAARVSAIVPPWKAHELVVKGVVDVS
jgi:phage repressor protein C with HTH and peptisase S24 domain